MWFHRVISGLDSPENADHPDVLKYLDHRPDEKEYSDDTHPKVLLDNLKNKRMKETMDLANIFTYDAAWTPKGSSFLSQYKTDWYVAFGDVRPFVLREIRLPF